MSDIDINKLRRLDGGLLLVFRELIRTRRASQAADRLGLSQPAISHALNRLRDLFEDPLFVRRPHGFEPTRRAEELAPKIEAIIELSDQALSREPGFDPSTSRRRFRFVAPEFVAALIGADLILQLKAKAPGVQFAIGHWDEDAALGALRRGEIDFALGRFGASRPGFVVEPLFEDRYCVAARADHPQLKGAISEAQWREIGHIFAWWASETAQDPPVSEIEPVVQLAWVPQWLTALVLASSTDGLVTCPRRLAERHAAKLGLQVLDMPFPPNRIAVSLMRRTGVRDAGTDWFLDRVREAVEG